MANLKEAPMTSANKLIALDGATMTVKESMLMAGGRDQYIDLIIPSFLIEHPKGLVLFDSGCAPEVAVDPGYWGPVHEFSTIRFSQDQVVDQQIKQHGYKPTDVKYVVVSHLHMDHSGGLKLFPEAQFLIMKGELPHAYWPDRGAAQRFAAQAQLPVRLVEKMFQSLFILDDLVPTRGFDWKEFEDDTDIFGDGSLMMLKTSGHTPGECSLRVRLKHESVILTGDTIRVRPQLETLAAGNADYDMAEASASIVRLRDIRDRGEARLWVNHSPEDWADFPHQMD
jgi:N-acyl homoserine lactone hydrolase